MICDFNAIETVHGNSDYPSEWVTTLSCNVAFKRPSRIGLTDFPPLVVSEVDEFLPLTKRGVKPNVVIVFTDPFVKAFGC